AACNCPCARLAAGGSAPRRAVARPRAARRRRRVRGAHGDPRARSRGAARRAARAAHGRARRPQPRARERRASGDPPAAGCGRHRQARGGVPRMTVDWQTIADAAALGGVYALMAVGIGLVFGVLRLVNFAYGQLIMAGAYALAFSSQWGWPRGAGIVF